MTPVAFPGFTGFNAVLAEDQPEYLPLPVCLEPDGCVTSCWSLTWRERWKLLLTGRLWISSLTFHLPLQPIKPSVTWARPQESSL